MAIALANADRHPHAAIGGIGKVQGLGGIGGMGGAFGAANPSAQTAAPKMGSSQGPGSSWMERGDARRMQAPGPKFGGFAEGGATPPVKMTPNTPGANPLVIPRANEQPIGGTESGTFFQRKAAEPGASGMAAGGMPAPPWTERRDAQQMIHDVPIHSGLIGGSGGGRTDQIPILTGSDSHVMPADVVSTLGQGNTAQGSRILDSMMSGSPYGQLPGTPTASAGHRPPPTAPIPHPFADPMQHDIASMSSISRGGRHEKTSILGASGEYIVAPEHVLALGERGIEQGLGHKGESAMDVGHRLLDEDIARIRKYQIEWLKNAPPPKK